MIRKLSEITRKIIFLFWISILLTIFTLSITRPEYFRAESLQIFLEQFGSWLLLVYFILSALRGLTLIPSTPFVIVGALIFPGDLFFVYMISMCGIALSVSMIYFFSREMGFEDILMKKYPKAIKKSEKWIEDHGFWAVAVTSFLLFIPTDVVSYIAGTLRMQYAKFIAGILLGEGLVWGIIFLSGPALIQEIGKIL